MTINGLALLIALLSIFAAFFLGRAEGRAQRFRQDFTSGMLDLRGGAVEIALRKDGRVLWVNRETICVLRICEIDELSLAIPATMLTKAHREIIDAPPDE